MEYVESDDYGGNGSGLLLPENKLTNSNILDLFNTSMSSNVQTFNLARLINIVLAAVGIMANTTSLIAMFHISGPLSANQRLIISLLVSDLFVSVTILVTVVNNAISPFFLASGQDYGRKLCIFMLLKALTMTAHTVSLFNLVILSVDHFVAINKPLRYIQLMTGKRVTCGIIMLWTLAALCGFSDFLFPGEFYSYCEGKELENFCQIGYCTKYETEYLLFPLVHACFIVMAIFYCQVFRTIYRYQKMAGRHQRHMKRNIKGLVTTLIILGTFLVCWLPHCIFEAYIVLKVLFDHLSVMTQYKLIMGVDYYLYSLWLLNSVCDPIIYAVRMREVKNGYYQMVRCGRRHPFVGSSPKIGSASYYRRSVTNSSGCDHVEMKLANSYTASSTV